jgi:putative ABC transport system substrate-binding protein
MKPIFNLQFCIVSLFVLFAAVSTNSHAQEPKIPRIGYLTAAGGSAPYEAFLVGMRELGYSEGRNIAIVYRSADGRRDRLGTMAADLVALKVDVIVADGVGPSLEAKKATGTIPIVMTSSTDPVRTHLVASLARPGGNITGLASLTGELGGKLLELLKETVPRVDRVAVLMPPSPANEVFFKEAEGPAGALRIQLLPVIVQERDGLDNGLKAVGKARVNGIISRLGPGFPPPLHQRLVQFAQESRLPAISSDRDWVSSGGLMFYGPDQNLRARRVATFVDKILKGAKPADLPVEQPTKFELVINLKTAKQIGLTIPPHVMARADRLIK